MTVQKNVQISEENVIDPPKSSRFKIHHELNYIDAM